MIIKRAPLRCARAFGREEVDSSSFFPALTPSARKRAPGRAGKTCRRAFGAWILAGSHFGSRLRSVLKRTLSSEID